MPTKIRCAALIRAALVTLGALGSSAAQDTPSFTRDIAPLLARNCVACHAGSNPLTASKLLRR